MNFTTQFEGIISSIIKVCDMRGMIQLDVLRLSCIRQLHEDAMQLQMGKVFTYPSTFDKSIANVRLTGFQAIREGRRQSDPVSGRTTSRRHRARQFDCLEPSLRYDLRRFFWNLA